MIHVLLVEDSDDDAFLVEVGFKKSGLTYEIHRVYDGNEGLDFLYRRGKFTEAVEPNIILTNVRMPNKDGTQFVIEVRQDSRFNELPICVLISSEADVNYLKRILNDDISCFVVKGIESVIGKVKKMLSE
jgi:CheY-like chemotaxis protein